MELALRTGWTPEVVGSLPAAFRRACHWRLWVGTVVGPDGLPPLGPMPKSGDGMHEWADAYRARKEFDKAAYPEDED